MTIREAITLSAAVTGQTFPDSAPVRWLSEYDGRLAREFYRAEEFTPYSASDMDLELLIPFPYDGTYPHYLNAMTHQTAGETDRYEQERRLSEEFITAYRAYMQRDHARPCRPGFPFGGE